MCLPTDADYIVAVPALSKTIVERGHCLDFHRRRAENSIGAARCDFRFLNHDFTDINNALALADAVGRGAGRRGAACINARYKIDRWMNRGSHAR
jgi:hypothetical protein